MREEGTKKKKKKKKKEKKKKKKEKGGKKKKEKKKKECKWQKSIINPVTLSGRKKCEGKEGGKNYFKEKGWETKRIYLRRTGGYYACIRVRIKQVYTYLSEHKTTDIRKYRGKPLIYKNAIIDGDQDRRGKEGEGEITKGLILENWETLLKGLE